MRWRVRRSTIGGTATVPGDKSIAHRALMLAALARGESRISGLPNGQDVHSTAGCLSGLGAEIRRDEDTVVVRSSGRLRAPDGDLDAGNSGTTMRLLAGILAGQRVDARLVGDGSLSRRPMGRIVEPLRRMGAEITSDDGRPPLEIAGRPLSGIQYTLPLPSAQVKSCVLLAGLFADGETQIGETVPTRDHSERMLKALGAQVERWDHSIRIQGDPGLTLNPFQVRIPGDASSAAFLLAASLLTGGEIEIEGVGVNPTRTGFVGVLKRAGADIAIGETAERVGEPVGRIDLSGEARVPLRVQAEEVPTMVDELPLAALVATQVPGISVINGAEELRVKETDRIAAVAETLGAMGAEIEARHDGFVIRGPTDLRGAQVSSHGDHRIAMMLAVAGTIADGETVIDGAESAAISYPEFADTFQRLGGRLDVD